MQIISGCFFGKKAVHAQNVKNMCFFVKTVFGGLTKKRFHCTLLKSFFQFGLTKLKRKNKGFQR